MKYAKFFVFLLIGQRLFFTTLSASGQERVSDTLATVVKKVELEIIKIDNDQSLTNRSRLIPSIEYADKKINVLIYEKNDIIRKLSFESLDESKKVSGHETYYFDSVGKLLGHVNLMPITIIHEIYSKAIVMIYTKSRGRVTSEQYSNDEMANYILADSKYT